MSLRYSPPAPRSICISFIILSKLISMSKVPPNVPPFWEPMLFIASGRSAARLPDSTVSCVAGWNVIWIWFFHLNMEFELEIETEIRHKRVIFWQKNLYLSLYSSLPYLKLGLLRLLIISYGTVTVTVYGYRSDTAVYGYFLTLVNTVNTVHFVKLRYFTVFYGYFGIFLPTVMYGYVRLPRLSRL